MSIFRKPKKSVQRRVFSANDVEENDSSASVKKDQKERTCSKNEKNIKFLKKAKSEFGSKQPEWKSLLSFADDDEDDEVFQVRKSSHSKKVMRMMDKERRRKKSKEFSNDNSCHNVLSGNCSPILPAVNVSYNSIDRNSENITDSKQCKSKKIDNIQTEIRTDDFVLVVKKLGPASKLVGRTVSDTDKCSIIEETEVKKSHGVNDEKHIFSKPEQLKKILESGSIPNAAMIHAAKKRRQKAREEGEVNLSDELEDQPLRGKLFDREDSETQDSDEEERVDMNVLTDSKELEKRREQFNSAGDNYSDDDSEREMNVWENQQIRKGVSGAQLVSAKDESAFSRLMITPLSNQLKQASKKNTSIFLCENYTSQSNENATMPENSYLKKGYKSLPLRAPKEIAEAIEMRILKLRESNEKHKEEIEKMKTDMKFLNLKLVQNRKTAPTTSVKYSFYQEIHGYVSNLVECLNEKVQKIMELEKRAILAFSKSPVYLAERRRQDVRDELRDMADSSSKCLGGAVKKGFENEDIIRRTAERECRRTRRRCEREKIELNSLHLDGMSSDDEVCDIFIEKNEALRHQLDIDAANLFADANDEFCTTEMVLSKFNIWRRTDIESYNAAFVSVCILKILALLIKTETLVWNPLNDHCKEIENMQWYLACITYGWSQNETEESLSNDPDLKLLPTVLEKIFLPKISEIVSNCWDPMSTTQNLRLIGLINRIGREYPFDKGSTSLRYLFYSIIVKMQASLENDVFIPFFPKQATEARTSFFQRQFCSALKLFRNFLSWQGIIAEKPLRDLAISSLLNRYLLFGLRICSPNDALGKACIIVNTLPTAWLQPGSETLQSLLPLIGYIKSLLEIFDSKNPLHMQSCEKAKLILQRLHSGQDSA